MHFFQWFKQLGQFLGFEKKPDHFARAFARGNLAEWVLPTAVLTASISVVSLSPQVQQIFGDFMATSNKGVRSGVNINIQELGTIVNDTGQHGVGLNHIVPVAPGTGLYQTRCDGVTGVCINTVINQPSVPIDNLETIAAIGNQLREFVMQLQSQCEIDPSCQNSPDRGRLNNLILALTQVIQQTPTACGSGGGPVAWQDTENPLGWKMAVLLSSASPYYFGQPGGDTPIRSGRINYYRPNLGDTDYSGPGPVGPIDPATPPSSIPAGCLTGTTSTGYTAAINNLNSVGQTFTVNGSIYSQFANLLWQEAMTIFSRART
ncbi:MAG: hypothetical protein K2X01_02670 [Cyanobacteria bacterium]|nr:hypothetical protein [Cyanobacteriota bacterium]